MLYSILKLFFYWGLFMKKIIALFCFSIFNCLSAANDCLKVFYDSDLVVDMLKCAQDTYVVKRLEQIVLDCNQNATPTQRNRMHEDFKTVKNIYDLDVFNEGYYVMYSEVCNFLVERILELVLTSEKRIKCDELVLFFETQDILDERDRQIILNPHDDIVGAHFHGLYLLYCYKHYIKENSYLFADFCKRLTIVPVYFANKKFSCLEYMYDDLGDDENRSLFLNFMNPILNDADRIKAVLYKRFIVSNLQYFYAFYKDNPHTPAIQEQFLKDAIAYYDEHFASVHQDPRECSSEIKIPVGNDDLFIKFAYLEFQDLLMNIDDIETEIPSFLLSEEALRSGVIYMTHINYINYAEEDLHTWKFEYSGPNAQVYNNAFTYFVSAKMSFSISFLEKYFPYLRIENSEDPYLNFRQKVLLTALHNNKDVNHYILKIEEFKEIIEKYIATEDNIFSYYVFNLLEIHQHRLNRYISNNTIYKINSVTGDENIEDLIFKKISNDLISNNLIDLNNFSRLLKRSPAELELFVKMINDSIERDKICCNDLDNVSEGKIKLDGQYYANLYELYLTFEEGYFESSLNAPIFHRIILNKYDEIKKRNSAMQANVYTDGRYVYAAPHTLNTIYTLGLWLPYESFLDTFLNEEVISGNLYNNFFELSYIKYRCINFIRYFYFKRQNYKLNWQQLVESRNIRLLPIINLNDPNCGLLNILEKPDAMDAHNLDQYVPENLSYLSTLMKGETLTRTTQLKLIDKEIVTYPEVEDCINYINNLNIKEKDDILRNLGVNNNESGFGDYLTHSVVFGDASLNRGDELLALAWRYVSQLSEEKNDEDYKMQFVKVFADTYGNCQSRTTAAIFVNLCYNLKTLPVYPIIFPSPKGHLDQIYTQIVNAPVYALNLIKNIEESVEFRDLLGQETLHCWQIFAFFYEKGLYKWSKNENGEYICNSNMCLISAENGNLYENCYSDDGLYQSDSSQWRLVYPQVLFLVIEEEFTKILLKRYKNYEHI